MKRLLVLSIVLLGFAIGANAQEFRTLIRCCENTSVKIELHRWRFWPESGDYPPRSGVARFRDENGAWHEGVYNETHTSGRGRRIHFLINLSDDRLIRGIVNTRGDGVELDIRGVFLGRCKNEE